MYGNYMGYQPPMQNYVNPYQNRLDQLNANMSKCEIVRVNGKNGAEAYQLPPNSSILLLDETAPLVWLAQTDGAGYKTVSPYSISPYQPQQPVDLISLEERIKRLEEKLNEQSNVTVSKQKRTNDATAENE